MISIRQCLSSPILKKGFLFGILFGAVGTVFILVSILVPMERRFWLRLFDLNGITMYAFCLVAGLQVARQTRKLSAAVLASVLASIVGCLIYTVVLMVAPYALFNYLVQYPFLHEDFASRSRNGKPRHPAP